MEGANSRSVLLESGCSRLSRRILFLHFTISLTALNVLAWRPELAGASLERALRSCLHMHCCFLSLIGIVVLIGLGLLEEKVDSHLHPGVVEAVLGCWCGQCACPLLLEVYTSGVGRVVDGWAYHLS